MKVRELMIGNFVDRNGLMEIIGIERSAKGTTIKLFDHVNNLALTKAFSLDYYIRPIRLLQKVIDACGFDSIKEDDYNYSILDIKHDITIMQGEKGLDVYELNHPTLRFKYLHQLQNYVFANDNKELKIDIDKLKTELLHLSKS